MRRVVVTGMGAVTSLGDSWDEVLRNLQAGASGVEKMPEWDRYPDILTRLGAPVRNFQMPARFSRKATRTMGRVAQMAVLTAETALSCAGLKDNPDRKSTRLNSSHQ